LYRNLPLTAWLVLCVISFVLTIPALGFVGQLLGLHIQLHFKKMTTYEYIIHKRKAKEQALELEKLQQQQRKDKKEEQTTPTQAFVNPPSSQPLTTPSSSPPSNPSSSSPSKPSIDPHKGDDQAEEEPPYNHNNNLSSRLVVDQQQEGDQMVMDNPSSMNPEGQLPPLQIKKPLPITRKFQVSSNVSVSKISTELPPLRLSKRSMMLDKDLEALVATDSAPKEDLKLNNTHQESMPNLVTPRDQSSQN
jgi:hypothetical protein